MKSEVKVFAPASVSNIASGFDIMGFAIEEPGDEIIMRKKDEPGVVISQITGDNGKLPKDAHQNTAGAPALAMLECHNIDCGVEIIINKRMPLGSGLGSSAASAVASAFAMNELFELNLSKLDMLCYAIEGEKIASGSVHADNVAPCLYGGFILIRGYDPLDIVEIEVPEDLYCTIIHPHIEISTMEARRLLPREIPLRDAITQWGNAAGLIAGLLKKDYALIGRSVKDVVAEPVRSLMIPGFKEMKEAALQSGALGCSISGSGPSLFALSDSRRAADSSGDAMKEALNKFNVSSDIYISKINQHGPRVI